MDPEERRLWRAYREEPTAERRERLILRYAPLVKYVSSRMAVGMPSHVDRRDLTQYGMFGLLDAIDKFDLDAGVRFETYASTRIRGSIVDELRSMDWVPRSVRRKARDIERAIASLQAELKRPPSDAELADRLGISLEQLADHLTQASMTSLAALDGALTMVDGDSISLIDTVVDEDQVTPHAAVDQTVMRELVKGAIGRLTERERTVIALYYFEGMTLRQIGDVLGVTESRISQIHSKAILTLRARLERDVAG